MEATPGRPQEPWLKACCIGKRPRAWACAGLDMGQREDVLLGQDPAKGGQPTSSCQYGNPKRLQLLGFFLGAAGIQKILAKREIGWSSVSHF